MGINIGTKLLPVGVLCCEGWRWYAGKDVRVDNGYNRRVVGGELIYRLDLYVVRRHTSGDEEIQQVRRPARVSRPISRFAGAVVGVVVSSNSRKRVRPLGVTRHAPQAVCFAFQSPLT